MRLFLLLLLLGSIVVAALVGLARTKAFSDQAKKRLVVGIVFAAAILAVVLLLASPLWGAYRRFIQGFELLTARYAVDPWLAKAFSVVFFAPLGWGLFKSVQLSRSKSHQRIRIATAAYFAFSSLAMYAVSRNAYFDHTTGEVLRWYAETPEGLRFFSSPGTDPKYGLSLQPVTPDVMVALERRERGQIPQEVPLARVGDSDLFDPLTGRARYWYYQVDDSTYQLFDRPGFHPNVGAPLTEVSPQIASRIRGLLGEQRRSAAELAEQEREATVTAARRAFIEQYLVPVSNIVQPVPRWAVLIADEESGIHGPLTSAAVDALSQATGEATAPFRGRAVGDGLADRLFNGDASLFRRLSLEKACERLLVGTVDRESSQDDSLEGLVTAVLTISVRALSCSDGRLEDEFVISARGGGFSLGTAAQRATEQATADLRLRLEEIPRP